MVKKQDKTSIVKIEEQKAEMPKLLLSVWYDEDTKTLLWDYGDIKIDLKFTHELIGILETIQMDLYNRLNE